MQQYYDKIVNGMTARGYEEAFAQQIFEQIKGFSEYGFTPPDPAPKAVSPPVAGIPASRRIASCQASLEALIRRADPIALSTPRG